MISELFPAASDTDAAAVLDGGPSENGVAQAVTAGELTATELDALQSELTGEPLVDVLESRGGGLVAGAGDGGPWVHRVRRVLVDRLAALKPSEVAGIAGGWAKRPEMEEHDPGVLAVLIPGFVALASAVGRGGQRLFIWSQPQF